MRRLLPLLLLVAGLLACSPAATVENVRTGVNTAVTGDRQINYAAQPEEIVSALVSLSARMQPDEAHTPYFVDNVTDLSVTLTSNPLTAATNISNSQVKGAIKIVLDISAADAGGYAAVTFQPSPADHKSGREARDAVIAELDKYFARYTASS